MVRYLVLLNFTDKGIAAVRESPQRAEAFRAAASSAGAGIEALFWTLGAYDGMFVLSAPDEATATAVVLRLARTGNVRTCMLRAFDAGEFKTIVDRTS